MLDFRVKSLRMLAIPTIFKVSKSMEKINYVFLISVLLGANWSATRIK